MEVCTGLKGKHKNNARCIEDKPSRPHSIAQCSRSYDEQSGPVIPTEKPRLLGQYLWAINVLTDALILITALTIMMLLNFTEDDQSSLTTNEDVRQTLFTTFLSIELAIFAVVSLTLIYIRHEPEIQSRNEAFMLQLVLCSLIAIISRMATVYVVFTKHLDSEDARRWYTAIFRAIGLSSFLSVPSALALRLRLIYLIMCCNDFQPKYYIGFLWHIPIIISSGLPVFVCGYAPLECSVAEKYSGCIIAWSALNFQFGYYLFHVRPVPGLFIDFWSNARVYIFFFCGSISFNIYVQVGGRPSVVFDAFCIWYPAILYVGWSEVFTICVLKVFGRRLGTGWFHDIDLCGVAHRYIQSNHAIESIFQDAYLNGILECLSKTNHFEECYMFMQGWWSIKNSSINPNNHEVVELFRLIKTHIVGMDCSMQINISYQLREAVLIEYRDVTENGKPTTHLYTLLADVADELKMTLREHIVAVYNQERVVVHCQRVTALLRVGLVIGRDV